MKRILLTLIFLCATFGMSPLNAETRQNDKGDNIVGEYKGFHSGSDFKVRFTRNNDGTYNAQMTYVGNLLDAKGNVQYDIKNSDKSRRNVPLDKVVIIEGLKYNAEKKQWDGAKIYDPQRGIKVKVTAKFIDDNKLRLRGSVLGIGESVVWEKL
ncbi:MAG: DUF2147 domain-containing protein [Bacteroidaceae bacterium]|nr:DUF2147 domain-containing protein [Bacteroidaceae bacterium]